MARDTRPHVDTEPDAPRVVSRRAVLGRATAVLGAAALSPVLAACDVPMLSKHLPDEIPVQSPQEALQRLLEGNARFRHGTQSRRNQTADRRTSLEDRELPFAQVLGCIDSRVPPELLFDRGLGDLMVTRTAGHVVDGIVMGSLEYGAYVLEVPLILVLGHAGCDLVRGALNSARSGVTFPGNLAAIYDALAPAITPADVAAMPSDQLAMSAEPTPADTTATGTASTDSTAPVSKAKTKKLDPLDDAVRRNVTLTVEKVLSSARIAERVQKGRLLVVGALYSMHTGRIELTDNVPEQFRPKPPPTTTPTT